jgi:hypothetical protein
MNVLPKYGSADSLVTVRGAADNYFNHFDRDSRRYDASVTLSTAVPDAWGAHLFRAGGQFARTTYDGIDESAPVVVTGAHGVPLARVDFIGNGSVGATNTELGAFLEDQWAIAQALTLHGGVRYAYDQITGEQTLAPRADASYRPFDQGGTVIKGGIGQFHDKLPLNAADFARQQSRLVTEFDASGAATSATLVSNRIAADGLAAPTSTAWNVELDQMVGKHTLARVGYRQTRTGEQLVVDPSRDEATLWLSSTGRARSKEFEATVRQQLPKNGHITTSYVYSSTKADQNDFVSLFGDLRDAVIRPNQYGPQAFEVPHRLLVWGVVNLPKEITVAPTVEYRTGFAYSLIDEQQRVIGGVNQERFPNLFTLDLAVTKDVQLTKTRRARVGMQFFNLTNHFNPQDVQNNVASPISGSFANSVDRQIRTKFTLLF